MSISITHRDRSRIFGRGGGGGYKYLCTNTPSPFLNITKYICTKKKSATPKPWTNPKIMPLTENIGLYKMIPYATIILRWPPHSWDDPHIPEMVPTCGTAIDSTLISHEFTMYMKLGQSHLNRCDRLHVLQHVLCDTLFSVKM